MTWGKFAPCRAARQRFVDFCSACSAFARQMTVLWLRYLYIRAIMLYITDMSISVFSLDISQYRKRPPYGEYSCRVCNRREGDYLCTYLIYRFLRRTTYIIIITFPYSGKEETYRASRATASAYAGGHIKYSGKSVADTLEKSLLHPTE